MTTPVAFGEISPGLPCHQDEIGAGHEGQPTVAVQDRTHGAGTPAEDRGMSDQVKYGGPPS